MKNLKELAIVKLKKKVIKPTILVVILLVRMVLVATLLTILTIVFFIGKKIFILLIIKLKEVIRAVYQFLKNETLHEIDEIKIYPDDLYKIFYYLVLWKDDKLAKKKNLVEWITNYNSYKNIGQIRLLIEFFIQKYLFIKYNDNISSRIIFITFKNFHMKYVNNPRKNILLYL